MAEEITILITGDFYGGNRIDRLINEEKYSEIFNDFLPLVRESDIAITNLESALTTESKFISKTGPAIKSSPKTINALKYAGFNLLTLANNHIMDFGVKGLADTLDLCLANEIDFVGAGMDLKEASSILYKQIKGIKLAFINIAENEWSTTQGDAPGANPLNPISNFYSIKEARKKADFVIIIVHGGHEGYQLPSPRMKETYRFFIDAGADVVINHHTHCLSGYEMYHNKPIFYSLGNFIFDWHGKKDEHWFWGYSVKLFFTKVNFTFDIIPFVQNKDRIGLRQLNHTEKVIFEKQIIDLNNTIQDDEKLQAEFERFFNKIIRSYQAYLEPHSFKVIHALQCRKYIPSMISKRKRLLWLNLIRCESHRDIILKLLNK
jgi:poly-gamma-glutamate capsule biosynthesis protein CapA/YwtB (metallophosphatase superfamily)